MPEFLKEHDFGCAAQKADTKACTFQKHELVQRLSCAHLPVSAKSANSALSASPSFEVKIVAALG